jgi:hypothetical protein
MMSFCTKLNIQYWANKMLSEVSDTDAMHTDWTSSFNGSSHSYIRSSGLTKPPEVLDNAHINSTLPLTPVVDRSTTLAAIPLPEIV